MALSPIDSFHRNPQELTGSRNFCCKQVGGELVGLSITIFPRCKRSELLCEQIGTELFVPRWRPVWLCLCKGDEEGGPRGSATVGSWGGCCQAGRLWAAVPGARGCSGCLGGVASRFSASIFISVTLTSLRGLKFSGTPQWRCSCWFLRFL